MQLYGIIEEDFSRMNDHARFLAQKHVAMENGKLRFW